MIEQIQAAGGAFVSVLEEIDLTTPAGRSLIRALMSLRSW